MKSDSSRRGRGLTPCSQFQKTPLPKLQEVPYQRFPPNEKRALASPAISFSTFLQIVAEDVAGFQRP
jgi:hypothetical protein